jgi:hypothetical protein
MARFGMGMQVSFDFAQGRLSTPLKNASVGMTAYFEVSGRRHLLNGL